jgi:NAD(P)-dependent dehydrogenase (short-subunit alcohol dehydrogenase family)
MIMEGQRVVIIGGRSGLGFAVAKAVVAEGASVVVTSRSRAGGDAAVAALPEGTQGYVLDATNEQQVRALFDGLGAFDHLVYAAGEPLMETTLLETDIEEVRRFFGIRYFGALAAIKYGAPNIRSGGSIVLTSGTASFRPQRGTTGPSSVFGAIEALTRALSLELAPIRVNVVSPGIIRTEMWSGLSEEDRAAMFTTLTDTLPVGRVGEPDDVAQAYIYLMRNKHSTGSTITIDGGGVLV